MRVVVTGHEGYIGTVLVPMLLLLPAPVVPLCVAAGYALGGIVDSAKGRRYPQRLAVLHRLERGRRPSVGIDQRGPRDRVDVLPIARRDAEGQAALGGVATRVDHRDQ